MRLALELRNEGVRGDDVTSGSQLLVAAFPSGFGDCLAEFTQQQQEPGRALFDKIRKKHAPDYSLIAQRALLPGLRQSRLRVLRCLQR